MAITLNHVIVHAKDREATARFLTELLGLPSPRKLGHFLVVKVGATSLDLTETEEPIASRYFAFLVAEEEFDCIFERVKARGVPFWADPFHKEPGQINRWDDGKGLDFDDPDGHVLEIITRPYGSGGLDAEHVNPLLSR